MLVIEPNRKEKFFLKSKRRGFFPRLIIALILIISGFYLSSKAVRPLVISAAKHSAKAETERVIYKIFAKEFSALTDKSASFVKISKNEGGFITSVETDTAALSAFSYSVAINSLVALGSLKDEVFSFSSGSLSGNPYLAGKGPKIPFRIETGKIINTEIKSDFVSAGINQTLHRLSLILSADITVFLAGFSETETFSVSAPISETVIVGVVPESFTDLSFLKRSFESEKQ